MMHHDHYTGVKWNLRRETDTRAARAFESTWHWQKNKIKEHARRRAQVRQGAPKAIAYTGTKRMIVSSMQFGWYICYRSMPWLLQKQCFVYALAQGKQ